MRQGDVGCACSPHFRAGYCRDMYPLLCQHKRQDGETNCALWVFWRARLIDASRLCSGSASFIRREAPEQNTIPVLLFQSSPFFPIPSIIFDLLLSRLPTCNSDPGSHSRLFVLLPNTVRALHHYRENISVLFSLLDSR